MTDRIFADNAPDDAAHGWPVGPCRGKIPLTAHGHLDFTTDLEQVARWARRHPAANIGARVPDSLIVIDVDPRADGHLTLAALEEAHGCLPATLTVKTGGHPGGRHYYFLRPPGALCNGANKLGRGLDVKLSGRGYTILPPSVHPETGLRYEWVNTEIPAAAMPAWLTSLLRPPAPRPSPPRSAVRLDGDRPGDRLAAALSWAEILEPAGWRFAGSKGQTGYWRRPGKAEGVSATTNATGTDHLHVFTSSAPPFVADESYSKFGAWCLLNAGGDFAAAARQLREGVR
jgi:hypothetical protein